MDWLVPSEEVNFADLGLVNEVARQRTLNRRHYLFAVAKHFDHVVMSTILDIIRLIERLLRHFGLV